VVYKVTTAQIAHASTDIQVSLTQASKKGRNKSLVFNMDLSKNTSAKSVLTNMARFVTNA
jgi:hypothetical protein